MILHASDYHFDSKVLKRCETGNYGEMDAVRTQSGRLALIDAVDKSHAAIIVDDSASFFCGVGKPVNKFQLADRTYLVFLSDGSLNILIRRPKISFTSYFQIYRKSDNAKFTAISIDDIDIDLRADEFGRTDIKYQLICPRELSSLVLSFDGEEYTLDESQWIHVSEIPDCPSPSHSS